MKKLKEDMVAGDYNPDRKLSFTDQVVLELERLNRIGNISPVEYNYALDFARVARRPITDIYNGRVRGLQQAVMFVLYRIRHRLNSF